MAIVPFPMHRIPPRPTPRLHIWRAGEAYELHHESRSGESWALLDRFPTREEAVRAALDALPLYPEAKLGRLDG